MQPPVSDDNGAYPPPRERQPTTAIPKTVGILNIVFGSLLLLCGIGYGFQLAMYSAMGPMFAGQQEQFQQLQQAGRKQKLQELEKWEQAAQNEKEKAAIQARQKALKAQPLPKMPDMAKFTQDVGFLAYGIADVVTGLIVNILLVVSGIGLLCLKQWGRQLGLWLAVVKIIRLVALYGTFILVVVPRITQAFTSMFQEIVEEAAKTAPPGQRVPGTAEMEQMGTIFGIIYTALGIGMMIFGMIYPVIVLVLLSRPSVKAACAPATLPQDSQGL